jgi:hypothetical protein
MGKKKTAKKAPTKECPKCGAKVHTRKAVCDCGHKFAAKAKPKAAPKKKAAKKAAAPKKTPQPTLVDALKAERKNLERRISKVDDLLQTYGE